MGQKGYETKGSESRSSHTCGRGMSDSDSEKSLEIESSHSSSESSSESENDEDEGDEIVAISTSLSRGRKRTFPISRGPLTRYERAVLISTRAEQLLKGAPSTLPPEKRPRTAGDHATKELDEKTIPLCVVRERGDGTRDSLRIKDLEEEFHA